MEIKFIEYDQVTTNIKFGFTDDDNGYKKENFTLSAMETLLKTKDLNSKKLERIKKSFIDKGGIEWLKKEISAYQKKLLHGQLV